MERNKYWYWLSSIPYIGVRTADKLLHYFGDVEEIFNARQGSLEEARILIPKQFESIIYSRNRERIEMNYESMLRQGIRCVNRESEEYPAQLFSLYDPPLSLFVKGQLPSDDEWMISVVGARSCTSYGREISKSLSRSLAFAGISVVSGMARGVDSAAHWGALEGQGKTYAILGCGVDICYPADNLELYSEIAEYGGILSEFAPGMQPEPANFPRRNRIIAALAKGILVVEARKKSGSLITVEHGLSLGKEIFAVPGRIDDVLSEGCNRLIHDGAKAVTTSSDILEEFGMLARETKKNNIKLANSEKVVYASMCLVPRSVDEIVSISGMSTSEVIEAVISMEMRGIVRTVGKNQYVLSV